MSKNLLSYSCRDDDEEEEEEEDGGEDPYEFSLSAVIDECARMSSRGDSNNPGASSSSEGTNSRKLAVLYIRIS